MKLQICAVYDKVAGAYLAPLFVRTSFEAMRMFRDAVGSADHQFCKHPEDFVLFRLGEFDDNTGAVEPLHVTEKLMDGLTAVELVRAPV
uniref:DNA binding protein VP5 n=1 Tax=Gokushovirinae environmental samples TaxID=1478972 RepID=A0A2R3UAB3_9VIRU|nr:DNA binding protein VP5 [Gokushovirinae environmental samples]